MEEDELRKWVRSLYWQSFRKSFFEETSNQTPANIPPKQPSTPFSTGTTSSQMAPLSRPTLEFSSETSKQSELELPKPFPLQNESLSSPEIVRGAMTFSFKSGSKSNPFEEVFGGVASTPSPQILPRSREPLPMLFDDQFFRRPLRAFQPTPVQEQQVDEEFSYEKLPLPNIVVPTNFDDSSSLSSDSNQEEVEEAPSADPSILTELEQERFHAMMYVNYIKKTQKLIIEKSNWFQKAHKLKMQIEELKNKLSKLENRLQNSEKHTIELLRDINMLQEELGNAQDEQELYFREFQAEKSILQHQVMELEAMLKEGKRQKENLENIPPDELPDKNEIQNTTELFSLPSVSLISPIPSPFVKPYQRYQTMLPSNHDLSINLSEPISEKTIQELSFLSEGPNVLTFPLSPIALSKPHLSVSDSPNVTSPARLASTPKQSTPSKPLLQSISPISEQGSSKVFLFESNRSSLEPENLWIQQKEEEKKRKKEQIQNPYLIDEIVPRLFLSSYVESKKKEVLKKLGITHILMVTTQKIPHPNDFVYLRIAVVDLPNENINIFFRKAFSWLDEVLENPNHSVLVHCNAGISRAPSFVIGYLMYKQRRSYEEIFNLVKSKRPFIKPNEGFVSQLKSLQNRDFRL